MRYPEFYAEVGKLLYAVADVDGMISAQEKQALMKIVERELVPEENHKDAYGTGAAWYAGIEFEILEEEIADAETAFESFINYVEEHHTAFNGSMKKVCLRITRELASVYHGTNKKEKEMIHRLERKLNKIAFSKNNP